MKTLPLRPSSLALSASLAVVAGGACHGSQSATPTGTAPFVTAHSSSMALDASGRDLFIVNPEADSVSVIDTQQRTLEREIILAAAHPAPDPTTGTFTPAVMPRAVALSPDGGTLYVSGERSGALIAIDVASGAVKQSVAVGSEPIGVVVSPDGASIFVACSQDATVVRVDAASLKVASTASVLTEPWALAWTPDGATLLVTQFMGLGVTAIDPVAMTVKTTWPLPESAPRGNPLLAHGVIRGEYDVAARPGSSELWVTHAMLAIDTPEPTLDFESTAFPGLSLLHTDGSYEETLSTNAQDVPGYNGAFADVVSGPHAVAFTPDGAFALVADANSNDVLVIDAQQRIESSLVRPLPGVMPDGILVSPDGKLAYVDERVSTDVAILSLTESNGTLVVAVDGAPVPRLAADPMPATLRLGQRLFNSADSSTYPITTNHWIACATCHLEGRSDAVTWKFLEGPRDTPSNAGGVSHTGFLLRTADRTKVQDYWHTINQEQGGSFDPTAQSSLLDALADYVNLAIPYPIPPTTDAALVTRGQQVFAAQGCAGCHAGAYFTDSGAGNPTLDVTGPIVTVETPGGVLLHDVGTCVTTGFPDVAHSDVEGDARPACLFDTPTLRGVSASPPYFHDGSAATIGDAIQRMPNPPTASADLAALAEYIRSL